jgi:hypothetical protein
LLGRAQEDSLRDCAASARQIVTPVLILRSVTKQLIAAELPFFCFGISLPR